MMPPPIVEVTAPSRLHFGMLSFGRPAARQFGGVGAMINQPGMRLRISPAERFAAEGFMGERIRATVERIWERVKDSEVASILPHPEGEWIANRFPQAMIANLPACRIEVISSPPEHVGLGTGTQLSLAVAAGLNVFLGRPQLDAAGLAGLAGRGERSAIGTYGFVHGGLLVETGKAPGEQLSPLLRRVELPAAWRFVLICPQDQSGLSGEDERRAFRELPPVPPETTAALHREILEELLPAAAENQFERFSESLYRYGYLAGMCFAARQGGPFASPRASALIRAIRELGIHGAGQSSWGPTLFALLPGVAEANLFLDRVRQRLSATDSVLIAEPNNSGAQFT